MLAEKWTIIDLVGTDGPPESSGAGVHGKMDDGSRDIYAVPGRPQPETDPGG
jgi:hypothetical protein